MSVKAAFLAFNGFAVWEVALLQMVLRRQDWVMHTLTLGGKPVTTDGGLVIQPTKALEDAHPRDYQLVLMAGGEIDDMAVENPSLHRFLRQYDATGSCVAAICASTVYLGASGLLGGVRFTALEQTVSDYAERYYGAIYTGQDVCADAGLVTAKGHAHAEWCVAVCERVLPDVDLEKLRTFVYRLAKNEMSGLDKPLRS